MEMLLNPSMQLLRIKPSTTLDQLKIQTSNLDSKMPNAASPNPVHETNAGTTLAAAPFLLVVVAAAANDGVSVLVDVDTVMVASVVTVRGGTVLATTTVVVVTTEPATVWAATVVASTVDAGSTVVPVDVDRM